MKAEAEHTIRSTPGIFDIPAVFADTGLEYLEIRDFVQNSGDVTILKPKMNFRQVIQKYGYPVVSKEVSRRVCSIRKKAIAEGREANHGDYIKLCGLFLDKNGNKSQFNCEKWKFLLDAPFSCSSECCTVMKKNPLKEHEKETGRLTIVAKMASESRLRKEHWLIHGCNAFEAKKPRLQPMSFWTEEYLYTRKFPLRIGVRRYLYRRTRKVSDHRCQPDGLYVRLPYGESP